jgi:uncharacterized protein (DUF2141 family)
MIATRHFILTLLLAASPAMADEGFRLGVTVTGVVPQQGQIIVSLYDGTKQYLKQPLSTLKEDAGDSDSLAIEFSGLQAGLFAVSVVYDVDHDGELDTGAFRIPKEPIGFSNNARGRFGPPKWKHTHFQLEQDLEITIKVQQAVSDEEQEKRKQDQKRQAPQDESPKTGL